MALITALKSDRRARSAFRDLVLTIAPPGAATSVRESAWTRATTAGEVSAYDVDPQMREFFTAHCRHLIDAGRVTLESGGYREFLARKSVAGGRGPGFPGSNVRTASTASSGWTPLRSSYPGNRAIRCVKALQPG